MFLFTDQDREIIIGRVIILFVFQSQVLFIIILMIVFLFFVYQVFKKLYSEENNQIKLILVGSISIILLQTLIHIGVNIRLFPTTGMTLPFISYGGSSIISTSILSGIILNLTKRRVNY